MKLRRVLAGVLLLASALSCDALSLGRTRGVIWIGQPLDLSIPVRLEPGESVSDVCVAADVFYADSRVSSSQVQVFAQPGTAPDQANVQIRTMAPVDEPVVNIYLRVGCKQALTRRYVLLAEVPVDAVAESVAPDPRGPSMPAVRAAPGRSGAAGGPSGPVAQPPAPRGGGRTPPVSAVTAPADATAAAMLGPDGSAVVTRPPAPARSVVRKRLPETGAGRARLRLDPADLLIERDPVLRASTELLTIPQEQDADSRRAGAAALWRAINATPDEVLRDAQRLQALQTDAALLRSRNQKNEAAVVDLEQRLRQVHAERHESGVVYALVAALLAALAAAVYFWNRNRTQAKAPQWWGGGDGTSVPAAAVAPEAQASPDRGASGTRAAGGAKLDIDLDFDLNEGALPVPGPGSLTARPARAALESVEFQTSLSGGERAVKVEELFDIQQQADFFISLGKYEQAVAMLRNHIADNAETSALAYLDLLKIYHLQGREKDYALVRQEFNDVFNAKAPAFAAFGEQTRGLESYQSAMSRIVALWPTPKVLEVIEESIFRKPGQGNPVFDLEAYRELLMLYSIAKEIVQESDSGSGFEASGGARLAPSEAVLPGEGRDDGRDGSAGFRTTDMQPLPTAHLSPEPVSPALLQVPPSAKLGLDIDLSDFGPASEELTDRPTPREAAKSGQKKSPDDRAVDFDIFEMATQAHAASKRRKP